MSLQFFFLRLVADIDLFKGVDVNSQGLGAVPIIIGNLINIAMFLVGALSVIFVIIGGIRYATSTGNPKATASALKTISAAVGGLILSLMAVAIVHFVFGAGSFLK